MSDSVTSSVVPLGKGIYLREMPHSPRKFARHLSAHGFRWTCVESTNGPWERHAEDLRAEDIDVMFISRFPHPDPFRVAADDMITDVALYHATGVCTDAENHYQRKADGPKRRALAAYMRDHFTGPVGFTSFPEFPAWDFVSKCDWGSPQVYDRFDDQDFGYVNRMLARWRRMGFARVFPSLGTYVLDLGRPHDPSDDRATEKPLARLRAYLESVEPVDTCCFWTTRLFQVKWDDPIRAPWWSLLGSYDPAAAVCRYP